MASPQDTVQTAIDRFVAEDREVGLQVAAYVDGHLAIDAVAGTLDGRRAVQHDSLFPIFSVTKGWTSTVIHRLVDRGLLAYDEPLAVKWPEFARHGKGNITLRHALAHNAGMQLMPTHLPNGDDTSDWSAVCAALTDATPVSPPGAVRAYHAVTFGWLVGEVARRVTGKPFARLLQEEIAAPLGDADLYLALPASLDDRVAVLSETFKPDHVQIGTNDRTPRDVPGYMLPLHEWMNQPSVRRADVPASSGIGSARAIARHYAALLPGGVDGVQLLSADRRAIALEPQGPDQVRALGYGLGGPSEAWSTRRTAFGHGGYGGAAAFADPEQNLAVAITKNHFGPTAAHNDILRIVRETLSLPA